MIYLKKRKGQQKKKFQPMKRKEENQTTKE
jgi:hypothetical protein